jgi:hypothetical protein
VTAEYNQAAANGLGANGDEPSIRVNWKTDGCSSKARLQTVRVTFNDTVLPAAATWQDRSATLPQCTAATTFQPILFTNRTTCRTFESQVVPTNGVTCSSDTDGDSWSRSDGGGIASGIDHQTVGDGPFARGLLWPIGGYPDAV